MRKAVSGEVINVKAVSGGKDDGDCAHIFVNGVDYSQNGRGLNIIVLSIATGAVLSSAVFDTHGSPLEAARLVTFVQSLQVQYRFDNDQSRFFP